MSFHFYLYRAPADAGPMTQWTEMRAQVLGTADAVKEQVGGLYPQIEWRRAGDASWSGLAPHVDDGPYLDVHIAEDEPGVCRFIVLNKASPSVMRRLMEALALDHVFAPESGDLVDPYAYEDGDRYYAKRGS